MCGTKGYFQYLNILELGAYGDFPLLPRMGPNIEQV